MSETTGKAKSGFRFARPGRATTFPNNNTLGSIAAPNVRERELPKMYQSGLTIKQALNSVSRNLYVLPAIQREFVWKPEQICRLFDSLMQGYPFGTFLFWKVEPEKSAQFKFYGFVQNYHERDAAHCPELGTLPNRELTAVLDGQQRLTALNIGLRGSLAIKEPNKWRSNPNAFPRRTLHLDLLATGGDEEEGEKFNFQFLEPDKATADTDALWYPVTTILQVTNPAVLFQWLHAKLNARGQNANDTLFNRASETLHRLYVVVHSAPSLTFYEEQESGTGACASYLHPHEFGRNGSFVLGPTAQYCRCSMDQSRCAPRNS